MSISMEELHSYKNILFNATESTFALAKWNHAIILLFHCTAKHTDDI